MPFIGRSGSILKGWITLNKISSYAVINTVPIMPINEVGQIRKPNDEEIGYFNSAFMNLVFALNPKYIILLGRSAEKAYYGNNIMKLKQVNFEKRLGFKFIVGFIYHPSYYLRNGRNGYDDIKELFKEMKT